MGRNRQGRGVRGRVVPGRPAGHRTGGVGDRFVPGRPHGQDSGRGFGRRTGGGKDGRVAIGHLRDARRGPDPSVFHPLQHHLHAGLHPPQNRSGLHADPDHQRHKRAEDPHLTPRQVGEAAVLLLVQLVEQDALHHREHVVGREDDPGGGDDRGERVRLEGADQREELADEPAGAREPDRGERGDHEGGGEERRDPTDPAEVLDEAGVAPLVHHPQQEEERAGGDPVADHHDEPALQPVHGQREDPDHHEPHVRHRGVGDQLLGVGLDRRHPRRVDDPRHADDEHHRDDRRVLRRAREEGQQEPEEAVGPHLEQQRGQDHRARGGRLHMRVRQPGVQGEDRHLDPEGEREGREEPELLAHRQLCVQEGFIAERVHPAAEVHVQDRDKHQQRSDRRVEEELDRGVDPALPAPDSDDEVHRDQGKLEEDVEEEDVRGKEDSDHPHLQQQHQGVECLAALLDVVERAENGDRRGQRGQQDHEDTDPVDPERVADPPGLDPGHRRFERKAASRRIVHPPQPHAQDEHRQGPAKREPFRPLGRRRQHMDQSHDRQPHQRVEDPVLVDGRERSEEVGHVVIAGRPRPRG